MNNNIKIIEDNILQLKKPVDVMVLRSNYAKNLAMVSSSHESAKYCMYLVDQEFNEDNVLDYLDNYKKAIKKINELDFRTVALEVIDMKDDDLTYSLAKEMYMLLKGSLAYTNITLTLICPNKTVKELYDMACFGEVIKPDVSIIDDINYIDVIVYPTTKSIFKGDKKYKKLLKSEPKKVLFKCLGHRNIGHGKTFFIQGEENCNLYLFARLFKEGTTRKEGYYITFEKTLEAVIDSAKMMMCKNIVLPIVYFSKNKKENKELVKVMVEFAYKAAETHEMSIKLYCPYNDLKEMANSYLEQLMEV